MTDTDKENRERDHVIAENEEKRQIIGDIRVSTWAITVAVVVAGLAAVAWMLISSH